MVRKRTTAKPSSSDVWFDEAEADRAVHFIENYCRHVKGQWAGQLFVLEAWQRELVRALFGWKRADGTRKHRMLWLEVPRKAGKTSLAATIALYMLLVDPEPGGEIVSAAGDADQASICFKIAQGMVLSDPDIESVCQLYRRSIVYKDGYYQVVSAKHETKHGANLSCCLFDEIHVQRTRDLFDVLATSMGARQQPLMICTTTAGWDRTSITWELHEYACKIRDGIVDDPSWLVRIFAADDDADWTNPKVWRAAHPGIGVSVSETFLQGECNRAKETPGFVNSFRRLYLNVWTEGESRWLDMNRWDACDAPVNLAALHGRECKGGLDLSTTTDLTALVLVFRDDDGVYDLLPYFWCPAEGIKQRSRKDRVPYDTWRDQGFLIATPGDTVDYEAIRHQLRELPQIYRITEIGYDRWNSSMLVNALVEDGANMCPVGQGTASLNAPCREFERAIAAGKVRHGGNPVLRWMAANTVVEMNAAGDIKPHKAKSSERIDGIAATLTALNRFIENPPAPPSIYCTRDPIAVDW